MININSSRGMALIQVLIIAIILSLLSLYITQTVRSQVKITGVIKDNHLGTVAIESAEADVLHLMMTSKLYPSNSDEGILGRWNFYGKEFKVNEDVTASIQDLSSLISLNHINRRLATTLFLQLGKSDEEVREFLDALADWKDLDDLKHLNGAESNYYSKSLGYGPRNGYLQSFSELKSIKGADLLPNTDWHKYFSLALVSNFNPLNAPDEILKALINDEQSFQNVINHRNNGGLNGLVFFQNTGIDEDDYISFRTGRVFRIVLRTSSKNNNLNKSFIVEVRPNSAKRPVIITHQIWNNA